MTFGKYRLVKVKPFGKTSGNLSLQTPRNPEEEEKKGKMRPTRGGKPHTTSCLKKKKIPHSGDRQPGCNKCPGKPFPQSFRIFRPGFLFFLLPQPQHYFSQPHLGEPGPWTAGEPCPAPPAATPLLTRAARR